MSEKQKISIGIMGGSFNPIHMGHLFLAEQARVCFNLSSVIFLPTGQPAYPKNEMPVAAEHRLQMTSLAINRHPHFFISRLEAMQKEPTYTIHSLIEFRKTYPEDRYELFFITGADAVKDILQWKEPERLLGMAQFIAGSRPPYSFEELYATIADWTLAKSRIHVMQIPLLEISSCMIREYLRHGKTIKYLVPESVEQYIYKYQLYVTERRAIPGYVHS